jgi:hypothetical protein
MLQESFAKNWAESLLWGDPCAEGIGEANKAKDTRLIPHVALKFLTLCAAEELILLPVGDNPDRNAEPSARAAKRKQQ